MPIGTTRRDYPIRELALSLEDAAPLASGSERTLVGDIVACRIPNIGIGLAEAHRYLWMRIDGFEQLDMDRLKMTLTEPRDDERIIDGATRFDKRRFCIPLKRLKQRIDFDVSKALDPTVIYQPFQPIDEDTFMFLDMRKPVLDAHGLIYDKAFQRFM